MYIDIVMNNITTPASAVHAVWQGQFNSNCPGHCNFCVAVQFGTTQANTLCYMQLSVGSSSLGGKGGKDHVNEGFIQHVILGAPGCARLARQGVATSSRATPR